MYEGKKTPGEIFQKYFTSIQQSMNYNPINKTKVLLIYSDYHQIPDNSTWLPTAGTSRSYQAALMNTPKWNSTHTNSVKLYLPWISKLDLKKVFFFLRVNLRWITQERNYLLRIQLFTILLLKKNISLFLCLHCLN